MEYIEQVKVFLATEGVEIGLMLIKGILVLLIGLQVLKLLTRSFNRFLDKRNTDESLKPFLKSLFHNSLLVLLVLVVLATIGIEMTSIIAVIGAAGLAIGLALQGTLQNFAGGVIILALKPFRTGDFVEGAGLAGTVKEIGLFNTVLASPDNVNITVPNSLLSNDAIKNYSTNGTRRVDLVFGIGYEDDLKKAKEILEKIIHEDQRVLKDPEPSVTVASLGDNSVNFNVRPWVNRADYWNLYWDMQEKVKLEFDKNNISIPFPQRDIHLYHHSENGATQK